MVREAVLLVVLVLLTSTTAFELAQFFPFGPSSGDNGLPPSDNASVVVPLLEPVQFYGQQRNFIVVSTRGGTGIYTNIQVMNTSLHYRIAEATSMHHVTTYDT